MNRFTTSDLCVECGLCCDGSLFADVELSNERELTAMESAGATVEEDEESLLLAQPCSALRGKCCSIYNHRPQCCRTFECLLLQQVQRNKVSIVEARQQIRSTLKLKAKIQLLITSSDYDDPQLSFRERCLDAISNNSSSPCEASELERMVSEFEMLVVRVFLGTDVSA